MGTNVSEVHVWMNSNKLWFVIVEASHYTCVHHSRQNSLSSNSFWQKESSVPYESIAAFHEYTQVVWIDLSYTQETFDLHIWKHE